MKQVLVFIAFVGSLVFFSCQKDNLVSATDSISDLSVTSRDSMGGHHHGHHGNGGDDSTHVHNPNDSTHVHHSDSTHVHPVCDSLHTHPIDTLGVPNPHHHKHH